MLELISVHVPKCAGTSFRVALQRAYGVDRVRLDYDDRLADPASPVNIDPDGFLDRVRSGGYADLADMRVVHGHFHIRKYRYYQRPCVRIAILRHPVDRTISNYYYWQQLPRHGHTLQNYVLDQRLSLVQFARLPFMRHFYERLYFAGVERSVFDYVGSVETLDEDLAALSSLLGCALAPIRENVGPPRSAAEDVQSASLRDELSEILRADIDFYRRWCAR